METAPTLSESDARLLARQICRHLRALGAHVTNFGVSLKREGFIFRAVINGRDVWVRTGQGNFRYDAVAAELMNEALHHADEFSHPELTIVKN
jgi:hypothetical protein